MQNTAIKSSSLISRIRREIEEEIFDYQTLSHALCHFGKPRDRITRLLASGDILRIKKGLYCFGEALRKRPVSREQTANLIFGPSYVSLDSALSIHGLIPERVVEVTSVTTGRSRGFTTPLGRFTYRTLSGARYSIGAELAGEGRERFLIASPEKALVDKVWSDSRFSGQRMSGYEAYLFEDLRISAEALRSIDPSRLSRIVEAYASRKIDTLFRFLTRGGYCRDG
jgi:hypothetical protein